MPVISGPGKRLRADFLLGALLLLAAFAATLGPAGAARADAGGGHRERGGGRGASTSRAARCRCRRDTGWCGSAPHSRTCVRLDRRVVYLGGPSAEQRCPAGRAARQAPRDRDRRATASGSPATRPRCPAPLRSPVPRPAPSPVPAPGAARASASSPPGDRLGRRLGLHRARLRHLQRPLEQGDGGLGRIAVPRRRHLHRRRKQRLLAAEPERQLGQRPDHRRLAPHPHLRRPAGADLELQQLRQADHGGGGQPGRGGGRRRGRRVGRARDRRGQPDLLRHGVLLADRPAPPRPSSPSSKRGRTSSTSSATSRASTPRAAPGSSTSPTRTAPPTAPRTTSGSPTGTTPGKHARLGGALDRLAEPPAHPPVPRRPRRHLRRGHDQHRQRLRRRGDGRGRHAAGRRIGPDRHARGDRRPGQGHGAGQRLGARPRRADRTALDQRRRRRARRPERRRNLRTGSGRQPRPHRRRRLAQGGRAQPRLRHQLLHDQVGARADLRLRAQPGARRQPPARLPDDDDPGRAHPLRPDARPAPGSPSTSPANSPPGSNAPATSASAPPTRWRRRAATERRGSTP